MVACICGSVVYVLKCLPVLQWCLRGKACFVLNSVPFAPCNS